MYMTQTAAPIDSSDQRVVFVLCFGAPRKRPRLLHAGPSNCRVEKARSFLWSRIKVGEKSSLAFQNPYSWLSASMIYALSFALTMFCANRSDRSKQKIGWCEGKSINHNLDHACSAGLNSANKVPQIKANFHAAPNIRKTLNIIRNIAIDRLFSFEAESVVLNTTSRCGPINLGRVPSERMYVTRLSILVVGRRGIRAGEEPVHLGLSGRLDQKLEVRVRLAAPS